MILNGAGYGGYILSSIKRGTGAMPRANALFRNRYARDEALAVVVHLRHAPIVAVYIAVYTVQNGRPSAACA